MGLGLWLPDGAKGGSMPELVMSTDGKIIGQIEGKVFLKKVNGRAHMLHTPPAWAIDARAFDQKVLPHADTIRIEDTESGTIYQMSTRLFNEKKGVINRQFGSQYFVTLHHWTEIAPGQKELL